MPEISYADLQRRRFSLRRVGGGYYSECFYNNFAKACMLRECRIERVVLHMVHLRANELASPLPMFHHLWEAIMVDIFFCPHVEILFADLLGSCRMEGEFTYLTVDSTAKPTPLL